MIEFFAFSWGIRILITFILGICVLTQTLALVLNFYRRSLTVPGVFENTFEIFILGEIIVFSLLHGQVISGYENGFVVASGYETIRIFIFVLTLILAIVLAMLMEIWLPLSVIPAAMISLPIIEYVMGSAFPWLFITALIFFQIRSIKICVDSIISIRTNISALSVTNAVDTLHTGVLFSENDGHILLCNRQMQKLMLAIAGKVFRNSIQFYEELISDKYESRYKKEELDGQLVYLLPDGTAWMFTKTDILFRMKNYIHISVADVSELWSLTAQLQIQDQKLRHKSNELKETIANLHTLSKQSELENAKMRAHDILGQRLTVLLHTIQAEHHLDYDLITSLSKGLLEELKAKKSEMAPEDELKNIQQVFAAIGVEINFEGQFPINIQQACLLVDIIREGSINAVRHGFATQINIKATLVKNAYNLTITNNGHTTTTPIKPGSGIGVMKKKVDAQGGNLDIIHHPIFTLSVVLPGGELYE